VASDLRMESGYKREAGGECGGVCRSYGRPKPAWGRNVRPVRVGKSEVSESYDLTIRSLYSIELNQLSRAPRAFRVYTRSGLYCDDLLLLSSPLHRMMLSRGVESCRSAMQNTLHQIKPLNSKYSFSYSEPRLKPNLGPRRHI
jgi:hypothetical protein